MAKIKNVENIDDVLHIIDDHRAHGSYGATCITYRDFYIQIAYDVTSDVFEVSTWRGEKPDRNFFEFYQENEENSNSFNERVRLFLQKK